VQGAHYLHHEVHSKRRTEQRSRREKSTYHFNRAADVGFERNFFPLLARQQGAVIAGVVQLLIDFEGQQAQRPAEHSSPLGRVSVHQRLVYGHGSEDN